MQPDEKNNKPEPAKPAISRRKFLRFMGVTGAATAAAPILGACAPAAPTTAPQATEAPAATEKIEVGMPLKGTKIKLLLNDTANQPYLVEHLSEFTQLTGIEVEPELVAFGVLLQQGEVELSSGSSNYDVMIMIFIKSQRWMRPGWATPLDDFIAKSNFDKDDFLKATTDAMSWQGKMYGIPFLAESVQMIYREDILSGKGLAVPKTFGELDTVLAGIHNPPEFYSYVMRTTPDGVHFPFPVWLQGFGGNVFRDPPNDLTPTLNTAEAIAAAENFTNLIKNYSIAGSQVYDTPDCQNAVAQGKAGLWIDALGIFPPILSPEKSTVADKVQIALVPGGPAGTFPQIASHGYQIPAASKNKEAAWEFIRWATSKEMVTRWALEANFSAVPRISVLTSPEYGEKYNRSKTKIGELIVEAINLAKPAYRTVPEFPEVGARIGNGLNEIISGQKSVKDALDAVQKDAEQIMIKGGNQISP
jgi:ABC-type glycerol-3-phosphate transport system substrate-binding protein